jgi:PTS system nitrogen regulatory IIA component
MLKLYLSKPHDVVSYLYGLYHRQINRKDKTPFSTSRNVLIHSVVCLVSSFFSRLTLFFKNHRPRLAIITANTIILNLKGKTKEAVIIELLDLLQANGKFFDRTIILNDILDREQTMSAAIPNSIALPRAKTNAVQELSIAIGIKKSGIDFDSALDDKTRIIVLDPPNKAKSLYKFILAIAAILNDDTLRSNILTAKAPDEVVELLRQYS